jgi:hypothetical protein
MIYWLEEKETDRKEEMKERIPREKRDGRSVEVVERVSEREREYGLFSDCLGGREPVLVLVLAINPLSTPNKTVLFTNYSSLSRRANLTCNRAIQSQRRLTHPAPMRQAGDSQADSKLPSSAL